MAASHPSAWTPYDSSQINNDTQTANQAELSWDKLLLQLMGRTQDESLHLFLTTTHTHTHTQLQPLLLNLSAPLYLHDIMALCKFHYYYYVTTSLHFGLATAWRKATTRDKWRHIVDTATLQRSTLWKRERESLHELPMCESHGVTTSFPNTMMLQLLFSDKQATTTLTANSVSLASSPCLWIKTFDCNIDIIIIIIHIRL